MKDFVCIDVRLFVYMHVCNIYMCGCMYVCMYVCMHACIFIYIYIWSLTSFQYTTNIYNICLMCALFSYLKLYFEIIHCMYIYIYCILPLFDSIWYVWSLAWTIYIYKKNKLAELMANLNTLTVILVHHIWIIIIIIIVYVDRFMLFATYICVYC